MGYAHKVEGNSRIELKNLDAGDTRGMEREEAERETEQLVGELVELQELLYAARRESLLIVLQGLDTSGKDGTIRKVTGPLNAIGCDVASFKVPTEAELAQDFLWRVHARTPPLGHIKIFNRSHYEDVLVVRVHNLVPEKVWRARYEHIKNFERMLADSRTIILKFYLHISKEEQEERLLEREQEATKFWKLAVGDWQEREFWDEYTAAYTDAINNCSSTVAPWFIVPADKKWFRNLAVAEALRDALAPYRQAWLEELEEMGQREMRAIEEYRQGRKARKS